MSSQRTNRFRPRRGFLSMELAMTLPIFGLMLFGLFEFSLLLTARGTVVEASRAGARAASIPGATEEQVRDEVRRVLGPRDGSLARTQIHLTETSGEPVAVGVAIPMSSASPDLLWPVGFSLQGRDLYAETIMVRE